MHELSTRYDRYTISSTEGVKKRAVWPGFWGYPAIKGSLSGTTSMSQSPAMVVKFSGFGKLWRRYEFCDAVLGIFAYHRYRGMGSLVSTAEAGAPTFITGTIGGQRGGSGVQGPLGGVDGIGGIFQVQRSWWGDSL